MTSLSFNFVSIPRCASQSIHGCLSTGKYLNHHSISKFPDRTKFSFAVIREPLDRIRSWFSYHWYRYQHDKNVLEYYYNHNLLTWAENGFPTHWGSCEHLGINHPLSQSEYVTIDGKIEVNYLIDYKKLNKGLETVIKRLNIKSGMLHCKGRAPKFKLEDAILTLAKERFYDDFKLYEDVSGSSSFHSDMHIDKT